MRHSLSCLKKMPTIYEEAVQRSGRFEGDSVQKLADWQAPFEACLRGVAAPPPELIHMVPDIKNHIRAAKSRFLFFKMDTVQKSTVVRGTASGQPVYMRLQPGVDVMVRLAKLPDVIAEPVYAVDLYILAFTAMYQKASRLPLVHLFRPDGSTLALLTSGSDGCNAWSTVPDGEKMSKHTICAMQLWGLLQFPLIPRHPIIGVAGDRCAVWGQHDGVAVSTFSKQEELELAFHAQIVNVEE
jgi:hypothetical protein